MRRHLIDYKTDILRPSLKSFNFDETFYGAIISLIPFLNLIYIPGYAFRAARSIGQGKNSLPKLDIFDSIVSFISTMLGLLFFNLLILIISIPLAIIWSSTKGNLGNFNIWDIVLVWFLLNLVIQYIYPILIVRYQIYNYYSRVYDISHILKLVMNKVYATSYLIALGTGIFVIAFVDYVAFSQTSYYVLFFALMYLHKLFSFILIGRTFYILESKYKIDHIPKHAKSEFEAVEI